MKIKDAKKPCKEIELTEPQSNQLCAKEDPGPLTHSLAFFCTHRA
uniref:Pantothenate kinase 3 n=1 Tax=Molossus molossus TaxID=27622 RepID=A0A7J8IAM3_MOLMO|nr:pantothenate kinase 3 [Molossus molossus]